MSILSEGPIGFHLGMPRHSRKWCIPRLERWYTIYTPADGLTRSLCGLPPYTLNVILCKCNKDTRQSRIYWRREIAYVLTVYCVGAFILYVHIITIS